MLLVHPSGMQNVCAGRANVAGPRAKCLRRNGVQSIQTEATKQTLLVMILPLIMAQWNVGLLMWLELPVPQETSHGAHGGTDTDGQWRRREMLQPGGTALAETRGAVRCETDGNKDEARRLRCVKKLEEQGGKTSEMT